MSGRNEKLKVTNLYVNPAVKDFAMNGSKIISDFPMFAYNKYGSFWGILICGGGYAKKYFDLGDVNTGFPRQIDSSIAGLYHDS